MAIVEYNYPGEPISRVAGDRYRTFVSGRTNVTLWRARVEATNVGEGQRRLYSSRDIDTTTATLVSLPAVTTNGIQIGETWYLYPDSNNKYVAVMADSGQTMTHYSCKYIGFGGWDCSEKFYRYTDPVIKEWQPRNGDYLYTFEIYLNNQMIFSRTETNNPENIKVLKCPSDTCVVDCGDKICCYGSDGIASTFFDK